MANRLDRRKLAQKILYVIVQRVVADIPVVGSAFSLGLEILDVVGQSVREARGLDRAEIIALLSEVPQAEIDRVVDDILASRAGTGEMARLTAGERTRLRRELTRLPSALERALAEARTRDRSAMAREEVSRQDRREQLEREIAECVSAEDWKNAWSLASRRYRLGKLTPGFMATERYLYDKYSLRRGGLTPARMIIVMLGAGGVVLSLLLGFLALARSTEGGLYGVSGGNPAAKLDIPSWVTAGGCFVFLAFTPALAPRLNRRPRALLFVIAVSAFSATFLAAVFRSTW